MAVLKAMATRNDFTNSELSEYLNWPINTVTPRIHELRKKDLVQFSEKRVCKITGRMVIAWKLLAISVEKIVLPEKINQHRLAREMAGAQLKLI